MYADWDVPSDRGNRACDTSMTSLRLLPNLSCAPISVGGLYPPRTVGLGGDSDFCSLLKAVTEAGWLPGQSYGPRLVIMRPTRGSAPKVCGSAMRLGKTAENCIPWPTECGYRIRQ